MSLISRKIAAFVKKVANLPPKPGGTMPVADLQAQFDAAPEELRAALNGVIDDIVADYALKAELNGLVLGQVPDGSLTEPKFTTALAQKLNDGYNAINAMSSITRQSIINGNFSINQRSVSGAVTLAPGQYGHDRWKAGAAGCAYTFNTINNVTTITITSGSLLQIIEGNNLYSGPYTLSWAGTAQGKIGAGVYGASGITANVTGGINLSIEFTAGTLSKVQLNVGNLVLSYQPRSLCEELHTCQRYYFKSFVGTTSPGVGGIGMIAVNMLVGTFRYPVVMRISPTLVITNAGVSNQVRRTSDGSVVAVTGQTFIGASEKGFAGVGVSGTPFSNLASYDYDIIADAEL